MGRGGRLRDAAGEPAAAQFDAGRFRASSRTSPGGVVPGVTVTATNLQTQQPLDDRHRRAQAIYTMTNLRPGRYDVSAELEGFKKASRTGVQLDGGARDHVAFTLEPGQITETVTVTAEATPMQTDVTIRKTVEAKDIELLSFNGPQPDRRAGAEAGRASAATSTTPGFAALSNGGFNINGGRTDENTITVDGAIAIRTPVGRRDHRRPERRRDPGSPGADGQLHAGVRARERRPDPLHHQERQQPLLRQRLVLLPRRQAAGQHLGAQPQHQRHREQRAGALRLQAVRLLRSAARSRAVVQGQAVLLRRAGMGRISSRWRPNTATVPTEAMRSGDFSELLGANPVLQLAADHPRPADGPAVPGQRHPGQSPVAERHRADEAVPDADARLPPGFGQPHHQQREPAGSAEGQHPVRLPPEHSNNLHVPLLEATNWTAIDAFRGTFPFARTDWDRPEQDAEHELDQDDHEQPGQRGRATRISKDQVFINVYTETDALQAEPYGRQLPVHLPGEGDRRQDPDDQHRRVHDDRRRAVPLVVGGTDPPVVGHHHLGQGAAHDQGGRRGRVLGRGRLRPDQRQLDPRRHQQPERPVRLPDTLERAARASASPTWRWACSPTTRKSASAPSTNWRALATDIFVQDSWKPTQQADDRGRLPLRASGRRGTRRRTTSRTSSRGSTTRRTRRSSTRRRAASSRARATTASCCRATASSATGNEPRGRQRPGRAGAVPRRAARLLADALRTCSSRGSACRTRSTTRRSSGPAAASSTTASRSTTRRCSAATRRSSRWSPWPTATWTTRAARAVRRRPAVRHAGAGPRVQAPDRPTCGRPASSARSRGKVVLDVTYVGRRGLYLQRERNINQLPAGHAAGQPGRQHRRAAPLQGLRRDAHVRERRQLQVQQPADQRRAPLHQRLQAERRLHVRQVVGQRQRQAQRHLEHLRRQQLLGAVELRPHVTCSSCTTSTTCRSGATRPRCCATCSAAGRSRARRSSAAGTPFSITRTNDIAGVGDGSNGQPVDLVGDPNANVTNGVLDRQRDTNYFFNPTAFATPAAGTFGNSTRNILLQPGRPAVGHRPVQELPCARHAPAPVPRRGLQLPQPPEPERAEHRHHEPELRPRHHQGRFAARHPAGAAVSLLGPRKGLRSIRRGPRARAGPTPPDRRVRDQPPVHSPQKSRCRICHDSQAKASRAIASGTSWPPSNSRYVTS